MINEYKISIQTNVEDGELKFRVWGKLNYDVLEEVWGFWRTSIKDAFLSFEEELIKNEKL